jgi:putative ATP-binding cassette transporter
MPGGLFSSQAADYDALMSFFHLLRTESQASLPRLIITTCLAGSSNAAILAAVNSAAQAAGTRPPALLSAPTFVLLVLIFIKAQQFTLITATAEIESIIHKVRVRLIDQVRRSELLALDTIGQSEITSAITQASAALTQATYLLAYGAGTLISLFFVSIYIAYQSIFAFVMIIIVLSVIAISFQMRNSHITVREKQSQECNRQFLDRLTDLTVGFKEIRLNRRRSDAFIDDITDVSRRAANNKIHTQSEIFRQATLAQSSLYILLGIIVFVVPTFSHTAGGTISNTTTALLFVIGSCWGLLQSAPILSAANDAAHHLRQLEIRLAAGADTFPAIDANPHANFSKIEVRDLVFGYPHIPSESHFQIGPLDFTLRAGELVFIAGGNGSGKSTFLKVLAGLYEPASGEIALDGVVVSDRRTREAYRQLFAAVFSEYHLFRKLYGIPHPNLDELARLLGEFQLDRKVQLDHGTFSTLDLSSGQRRRLALVVSLLETRPILLLDEWAANQDPEFRLKYYTELLPALNLAGATLVVVTHDEQYFDRIKVPFRRLRMDMGRFAGQDQEMSVS